MRWTGVPALAAALVLGCASLHTATALADADGTHARSQKWTTVPVALGGPDAQVAGSGERPSPEPGSPGERTEDAVSYAPPGAFDIAAAVVLTGGALCVTYAYRRRSGGRRSREDVPPGD
ncbi:hypothetical protein ACFXPI_02350 [Streptomyces sp. NPDC059104]|uniref:hypothetical protein n=1 Tax=Streptomyces sp. NPDC059104 TaxID=3346729 RepID=UPI0036B3EF5E